MPANFIASSFMAESSGICKSCDFFVAFFNKGIYNTLMKQTFAIIVNPIAFTSEREDDSPRVFVGK